MAAKFWLRSVLAISAGLALGLLRAHAAEPVATFGQEVKATPETGWIVTVDGNVSLEPEYPGSSTRRLQRLPGLSLRPAGTPAGFSSPDDGLDFAVLDIDWFKIGPVIKVMGARSARNNHELKGLRSVNWTLEGGGFAEYWPIPFLRTRAEVRQGLNGHKGLVGSLGADLVVMPAAFTLALGPRLNFGNDRFMHQFFSISPAEALASGRVTPFRSQSGAYALGLSASARYDFSTAWSGTLWGNYQRLLGQAAQSPIPRVLGSRNVGSFGLEVSYSFAVKGL